MRDGLKTPVCFFVIFMLAARCVFLARMPIIMFVLVYRVVGCAILILVPMSVSHIMMLGFTLLPRTFAEYACRFVEIR